MVSNKMVVVSLVLAFVLFASGLYAGGKQEGAAAPKGPVTLEFTVWMYAVEVIQANVKRFEEANPDIHVNINEYTWSDYHDTMVLRLKGGTPTHVLYVGEDWLPEWASAGWLAPIEDYFPEIRAKYGDKIAKYAIQDMTYKGKLYGLSYYADMFTFMYNERILKENGLSVPIDWDQVLQSSLKLKRAGMDKPYLHLVNQTLPNFYTQIVSAIYGRGGQMFDKDLNPLFNDPNSEAYKHIQWLQDANLKHKIMAIETDDTLEIPDMGSGKNAFTVTWNYQLAAMNQTGVQPRAGEIKLALMPGKAHGALGFAKFYGMTAEAAKSPAYRNATWKFIQFMGGNDFSVAKGWALEKGIGFAQLQLFDDQDVMKAWSKWIDLAVFKEQASKAVNDIQTEWKGIWSGYFRPLLAKVLTGESSVKEAVDAGAAKWNEYRALMKR